MKFTIVDIVTQNDYISRLPVGKELHQGIQIVLDRQLQIIGMVHKIASPNRNQNGFFGKSFCIFFFDAFDEIGFKFKIVFGFWNIEILFRLQPTYYIIMTGFFIKIPNVMMILFFLNYLKISRQSIQNR